ncbi:MAG TPA: S8 family serine peptidase, partial [Gaiellaceae bacterium]|nr:S8 family serine peptidase [Gaiellaceae bacterium]
MSAALLSAAALALPAGASSPAAWQYGAIGETAVPSSVLAAAASVKLAVIDTGANTALPALASRAATTYNVRTHTRNVGDSNGHGTLVASLAAEASGDARLLIIKAASPSGAITDSLEAAAIRYAVDHGARIVNLSIGGSHTSSTERAAVQYADSRGVLIVAPSGNGYGDAPEYPAALLGNAGLAVAATDEAGARAAFSNRGPWISVAAPGVRLFAGSLGYASGTSFAAPLAAGAAALVWGVNPALTARQVVRIIESTASG